MVAIQQTEYCPECGGFINPTNLVLLRIPPAYEYCCQDCHRVFYYTAPYELNRMATLPHV